MCIRDRRDPAAVDRTVDGAIHRPPVWPSRGGDRRGRGARPVGALGRLLTPVGPAPPLPARSGSKEGHREHGDGTQ